MAPQPKYSVPQSRPRMRFWFGMRVSGLSEKAWCSFLYSRIQLPGKKGRGESGTEQSVSCVPRRRKTAFDFCGLVRFRPWCTQPDDGLRRVHAQAETLFVRSKRNGSRSREAYKRSSDSTPSFSRYEMHVFHRQGPKTGSGASRCGKFPSVPVSKRKAESA